MSTKTERGTKRTCQSASCSARFYDLNRDPIVCPSCGTVYEMLTTTAALGATAADKSPRRTAVKKPEFDGAPTPADAPDADADEALAEIETDEALDDDDDETFLEAEEEDGGDVSGIIGGPVTEGDEEP